MNELVTVVITYEDPVEADAAVRHILAQEDCALDVVAVSRKPSDRVDDSLSTGPAENRVRWIQAPSASLAVARNTGLAAAAGLFIVYLLPLDRLLSGALTAGVDALRHHPDSAFVYGTRSSLPAAEVLLQDGQATRSVERDHYVELLRGDFIATSAVVMYRRSALDGTGGYDEKLTSCEDYELNLRLARSHEVYFHGRAVALPVEPVSDGTVTPNEITTALGVLRRQRLHVQGNARLRAAYEEGLTTVADRFGFAIVSEMRKGGRSQRFHTGLVTSPRYALALLHSYPKGLTNFVARELLPYATRRWPRLEPLEQLAGPSRRRAAPSTRQIIQEIVGVCVPPGSSVLVVNLGDNALLDLSGVSAAPWPAPAAEKGTRAEPGSPIEQLATLSAAGAEYLVVPGVASWWVQRHPDLVRTLKAEHRLRWEDDDCQVWQLGITPEAPGTPGTPGTRALVAGFFSYSEAHATAGDLMARDVVCKWLDEAGFGYDVALTPPFRGGVDWRSVDPTRYSHLVFVCGPFPRLPGLVALLERFAECRRIGVNLSMTAPLAEWNPFDVLLERDSESAWRSDVAFCSNQRTVPLVGVCLREHALGTRAAEAAIARLVASTEMAVVEIDTRLDRRSPGPNHTVLRSVAEVEALIAHVDVVVTTRLHGLVLALKNGVPVVAIDPGNEGNKILHQAELVGWPMAFGIAQVTDRSLRRAYDYCLSEAGREHALECAQTARTGVAKTRSEFLSALTPDLTVDNGVYSKGDGDRQARYPRRSAAKPR